MEFEGAENIQEYQSSAWASRAFCKNCGTHLYYRLLKTNAYNMPVGIFSSIQGLVMDMQYFIDKRPDYYCLANQTKEMTEAEIISYFATQM
ncbi:MAG: hypothetical protein OFPII_42690 [Osedax symbiont Rs1]|nr:MAG: hypothetical protein OFPII_42690 [Osedax symbiont Rs1]